jgi:3-dehydroquinate synthase
MVLCGFMGTGKTAAGKALARRLDVSFVDTDERIEAAQGAAISDIFAREGQARFRELEREIIAGLAVDGGAVIATGGGALLDKRNRERLERLGPLVLLDADFEVIAARVAGDAVRPLAAEGERLRELYEERRAVYDTVALRVDTSRRTPAETAQDVHDLVDSGGAVINLRADTHPLPGRPVTPDNHGVSHIVCRPGAASELGEWLERLDLLTPVVFLIPRHLEELHIERLHRSLDARGVPWSSVHVDDGDQHKTLDQAARLLDALAALGAARDTTVVAVGGGVTGDIGGFVAATYMRGLPWINVPTTLLAQVDASIGGKTGVNSGQAKNIAGAFHQPLVVLSDPAVLETLPSRERSAGMAEAIKTAMIGDAPLFDRLTALAGADAPAGPENLGDVVRSCARVKAGVVERDPYERDLRRVLNLGHTLGHALETATGYETLRHGEAVGLGLLAAVRVAVGRRLAAPEYAEAVRDLLEWASLPVAMPRVEAGALRTAMMLDKKRRSGRLTVVLPRSPGSVEIRDDVTPDELIEAAAG